MCVCNGNTEALGEQRHTPGDETQEEGVEVTRWRAGQCLSKRY